MHISNTYPRHFVSFLCLCLPVCLCLSLSVSFCFCLSVCLSVCYYSMHCTFSNNFRRTVRMLIWLILLYVMPLFAERLANFIVTLSNISFPVTSVELAPPVFIRCGQYKGHPGPDQTGTVTCSSGPRRGRYVFISLPIPGVLTVCEARVFTDRPKFPRIARSHTHQHITPNIYDTDMIYWIDIQWNLSITTN